MNFNVLKYGKCKHFENEMFASIVLRKGYQITERKYEKCKS